MADHPFELHSQHADVDVGRHPIQHAPEGARKRNGLETGPVPGVRRERRQHGRHAVLRAVTTLHVDVDDVPVLAGCAVEFQHQAGLADTPGCKHQHVLALVEVLPQSGQLVLSSVEVVAYYRLADDVPHVTPRMDVHPR